MVWLIFIYIPDYYVEHLIRTPQDYFISKYGNPILMNKKHSINVKEYLFLVQQTTCSYKPQLRFLILGLFSKKLVNANKM